MNYKVIHRRIIQARKYLESKNVTDYEIAPQRKFSSTIDRCSNTKTFSTLARDGYFSESGINNDLTPAV